MKTFIGPKLKPWQKAVTDILCTDTSKGLTVCVKAPRQRGKSYMCLGVLLWFSLNHNNSTSSLVSPTLAQARKVFKELTRCASKAIKRKNETLLEIEFINGSTIFFKSAEMRDNLRGYTVDGILIIDEGAYMPDSLLELVLPWRQVSNCPMLVVSSPRTRDGFFYQYYQEGLLPNTGVITVDWNDFDTSEMISPQLMQQYKKILTRNQFKSEIEGEFLDGDGLVFTNIKLSAIAEPYNGTQKYQAIYGGIDFGAGGGGDSDYTALSLFNEKGEMIFLDYFNDLGTFQTVERLLSDLEPFKQCIKWINAENNSIGSPFIDLLLKTANERGDYKYGSVIHRWTTTNPSKAKLVSQLQAGLEQGNVKLLNENILLNQLSSFEATYNVKSQTVTYEGAHGTHDDCTMSTMLGWDAYWNHGQHNATVSIGFGSIQKR